MKFIKKRDQFVSESNDSDIDVPKVIWDIHSIFNEFGHKLYLVGGTVRDFLTAEDPKDFDIVSNATPDEIVKMLIDKFGVRKQKRDDYILNNRWRINQQGKSFGVVVVYVPGEVEGIDIASFNTRHNGEIVMGVSLEDDADRRDITFNALYYDLDSKEIIDLVGGVEDLKNKRLNMVGDPNKRIQEDPLRIQRLFRFGPRYQAEMNQETKDAINNNKHLYREPTDERPNGVSQERIIDEFMKSFKTLNFQDYIDYIDEFEMWNILFPGISFEKAPKFVDTKDIVLCLAQLFINEPNNIFNSVMVREWKLSDNVTKRVKLLVDLSKASTVKEFMNLKSAQLRFDVSNEFIQKWIDIIGSNDPLFSNFLKYDPTQVSSIDIMDELGIEHTEDGKLINQRKDGPILGRELAKRKTELFKSL
ncbi:MAG: gp28 [uncultured marine phage]|uniref:Gp28 n=1 Tax=uncultured marine phage TaxID=707152 RepID=A0A8D9FQ75_9VIRU|nr:MAG: gp28 [uncultured marine phage]